MYVVPRALILRSRISQAHYQIRLSAASRHFCLLCSSIGQSSEAGTKLAPDCFQQPVKHTGKSQSWSFWPKGESHAYTGLSPAASLT